MNRIPHRNFMDAQIRTLDLFHGAGGSSTGAKMAGARIVAGIDNWNTASHCYRWNFPEALSISRDIKNVRATELQRRIGDIDLIIASPECTSHSCAKGAATRDENSRETAFQVIKFAKAFEPRWIVIENVLPMQNWVRYTEFISRLESLDYAITPVKLNAKDFGVPQSRTRLFLICSREEEITWEQPPIDEIKPASSAINLNGRYPYTPLYIPNRAEATIERAERAMAALGNRQSFLIVYYGTDGSGGWQSLDQPLRTITTLDRFAYVKYVRNRHMMRMLQPEELKLGMGFPTRYELIGTTRRDRIKLMGNAVCPPVMHAIVRTLIESGVHSVD